MSSEYFKKVKKLITEKTGLEPDEVEEGSYFEDDLNMDRMELVEILTELEDEYHIDLIDEKDNIETVKDLLEVLAEKLE